VSALEIEGRREEIQEGDLLKYSMTTEGMLDRDLCATTEQDGSQKLSIPDGMERPKLQLGLSPARDTVRQAPVPQGSFRKVG